VTELAPCTRVERESDSERNIFIPRLERRSLEFRAFRGALQPPVHARHRRSETIGPR
jgi:hypothetical protein